MWVIGVYSEASFLINVAISHCYDNWVYRDVHHHHVKYQEANAKLADRDDVESTASHSESLEQPIDCPDAGREVGDQRVSNLSRPPITL